MPQLFFDVDDADAHTSDRFGVDLPDLEAATKEAATKEAAVLAGELLRDRPQKFWATQEWKLTVEDGNGLTLFTILVAAHVAPAAAAALPAKRRAH